MKCANPECRNELHYLRGGTLRLLEIEASAESRLHRADSGFPVCRGRTRYFWLCPECSKILVLQRWSQEGLVLETRASPRGAPAATWTVLPKPAVDADSILYFPRPVANSA